MQKRAMRAVRLVMIVAMLRALCASPVHAEPADGDFSYALSEPAMRAAVAIPRAPVPPAGPRSAAPLVAPPIEVPTPAGMNVRVNNPGLDTPELTTQNETSLAVRGSTVCAAYNNTHGETSISGFSRSGDG